MHAFLHSCGNISEILPDLIELGLDVIHPIQANAMNQEETAQKFGGKITFFGGIDVQDILARRSPEEVIKHIKWLIEIFGHYNGGYLPAPGNAITPDTPLANIEAMCKVLREYRKRW